MDATPAKRNAFAVLTGSGKRKRPCQAPQELDQPSSYRTCPLCAKQIPRALIQNHAENCKGVSAHVPVQASDTSKGQELQPLAAKASVKVNCSQQMDQDTHAAPARSWQPPSAPANAFSYLMAEQREQSQVIVFFLEQMPDKAWRTYWWTKGSKSSSCLPVESGPDSNKASAAQTERSTATYTKSVWSMATQILSSVVQSPTATGTGSSKSKVTVQLQTNVAPGSEADLAQMTHTAPGTFKGSPSLLKSALQKNVRLGRAAPAVRCALQLMKDNAGEFLRRISIICLEDAILHPDMPLLVWLMCAQAKGYTIGAAAAAACLQIVYQLACMPVRDHYPVHLAEVSTETAGVSAKNDEEELLVRCIAIRAAYGGMAGDVTMLREFAAVWSTRHWERQHQRNSHKWYRKKIGFFGMLTKFLAGATCPYPVHLKTHAHGFNYDSKHDGESSAGCTWLTYLHKSYTSIPLPPGGIADMASMPLKHADIPLSAVDFHISSIVEELMQKPAISAAAQMVVAKHGQRDANDPLRRAMWLFRSSLNTKKELGNKEQVKYDNERQALQPIWHAAQAAADAWSMHYIRQRFG